jgi:hypothetical protein
MSIKSQVHAAVVLLGMLDDFVCCALEKVAHMR